VAHALPGDIERQSNAEPAGRTAQVVERACALAQRIAAFPPQGVARIKSSIRAAGALRAPREWFDAAAAHDPLAATASRKPGRVS